MPETILDVSVRVHLTAGGIYYTVNNEPLNAVGEIALADLADYARGSIIRGGSSDWEAYAAETTGYILQGDGTDVVSAIFDWDVFAGAGGDMVHDHSSNAEGGLLPAGSYTHTILDAAAHTDTVAATVSRGSIIYGTVSLKWAELVHPAVSGAPFVTIGLDVGWDQTPTWSGLHTFGAGWVLSGSGVGDLDGNNLVIDQDGDTYLGIIGDDNVVLNLATASGQLQIQINSATDFIFSANNFLVQTGSTVTIADATVGGVLFAGTGGVVAEDSNNLFWDNTNKRLGIGTLTPNSPVTIVATSGAPQFELVRSESTTQRFTIQVGGGTTRYNSIEGTDIVYGRHIWESTKGVSTVERARIDADGDFGVGVAVLLGQVHVDQSEPSGNQPVLYLDQGDVSKPCIQYSSDATDRDIHLWTISVTGTPHLTWDESENSLVYSVNTPVGSQAVTTDLFVFQNTTAGTAAANFGTGILYQLEDAGGTSRDAMRLSAVWQSAAAAENSEFQLWLNYNGTLYEAGIVVAPGAASVVGNQRGNAAVDWQVMRTAGAEVASGYAAVISGGYENTSSGSASVISGGLNNTASDSYATVSGGQDNVASGGLSTVVGGYSCLASGERTVAGGYDAHATHDSSIVFSATNAQTLSWAINSWTVRCHGGARFYSAAGTATGVQLSASGTSWNPITCTREYKENLRPVEDVLVKIAAVPVFEYNLKVQDPSIRHVSPIAPDFSEVFGFTENPQTLNMLDLAGVTLAGVQALIAENEALKIRVARLERLVTAA